MEERPKEHYETHALSRYLLGDTDTANEKELSYDGVLDRQEKQSSQQ